MQGDRYGSMFILHATIQCDQHHLSNMLSLLQSVSWASGLHTSGYRSVGSPFCFSTMILLLCQCNVIDADELNSGPVFTEQVLLPTDLS